MIANSNAPAPVDAWAEFKKNAYYKISPEMLTATEAGFPSLTLELWTKEFLLLVEGVKNNSMPVTRICIYLRNFHSTPAPTEEAKRVRLLEEALENNASITSVALPMEQNHRIDGDGREKYLIPFFKFFSSPQCRVESLDIQCPYDSFLTDCLTVAFKKNTSLRKLKIRSNSSEPWTCFKALLQPLESLCLDLTLEGTYTSPSKKGMKAVISTLKNSRALTEFELKFCPPRIGSSIKAENVADMEASYKSIFTQLSKMTTLKHVTLWARWDLIADVLQSNVNLETAKLYSSDELYSISLFQALQTLSQRSLKKLTLDVNYSSKLISALENNTTIISMEIINEVAFALETGRILASMKSLNELSLIRPKWRGVPKSLEFVPDKPQEAVTGLIGPKSAIKILRIYQYPYIPTEEFLTTLKTNTSLTRLELLAPNQPFTYEFMSALQMNPFLEIIWTTNTSATRAVRLQKTAKANTERLPYIISVLTLLQTILLPKDRGVFSNVPIEVIFNIFQYFTLGIFRNKEMAVLHETASQRDWILSNRDVKDKLRCLWRDLIAVE